MNAHTRLGWCGYQCADGKVRYAVLEVSEYEVLHALAAKALKNKSGQTKLMHGAIRVRLQDTKPTHNR
jgi:hypothetical protein